MKKDNKQKEESKNKLEKENNELEQLKESLKRSQAEFANYKRRSEEEKSQIMAMAKIEVVVSMLPVYESCRRALELSGGTDEGLEKIVDSFLNILQTYNIKRIDLDMNSYDPALAEAVGFKDGKKTEDGRIAEVVEEGFMMNDIVIKPARVLIFKS